MSESFKHLVQFAVLTVFFGSLSFTAQSQGEVATPIEPTPPAPNAAKLAQFTLTPTSPYTGAHNLSIPLHTIVMDGASIPISISYHSGGIRASENASWVGLGWALSNAGSVSRTVNGSNDLYNGVGYKGYVYDPESVPKQFNNFVNDSQLGWSFNDPVFQRYRDGGPYDTEPDIFSYSFLGGSGSFVLSKKSETGGVIKAIKLEENNDLIVYDEANDVFEITNPQGFKATFAAREYSLSVSHANTSSDWSAWQPHLIDIWSSLNSGSRSVTSWHITQITSPSGRTLNFNYDVNNKGYSHYISISSRSYSEQKSIISPFLAPSHNSDIQSCSRVIHEHLYLNSITSSDLNIDITFNKVNRLDVEKLDPTNITYRSWLDAYGGNDQRNEYISYTDPVQRLSSIQVSNTNSGSNFSKNITFHHSYFNDDKINASDKEDFLRLRLDRLTVEDQEYSFNYYNGLPNKATLGVDYWGYYNGKDNNQHLYPVQLNYNTFIGNTDLYGLFLSPQNFYYQTENRKANFAFGKAGLLYEVKYPTGGTTRYQYESHQYKLEGQEAVENNQQVSFSVSGLHTNQTENFTYTGYGLNGCSGLVELELSVQCKDFFLGGDCDIASQDATKIAVELVNNDTGFTQSLNFQWLWAAETSQYIGNYTFGIPPLNQTLPAGNYTLRAYGIKSGGVTKYYGDATIKVPASCMPNSMTGLQDVVYNQVAGGARVNSVTSYDKDGKQLLKKSYYYASEDQDGVFSSGRLMNPLLLMRQYNLEGARVFTFESGSQLSGSSNAQGSHIGYSYVREVQEGFEEANNGITDYYYYNRPNIYYPLSFDNLAAVPQRTFSHSNGHAHRQSVFSDIGEAITSTSQSDPYTKTGEINAMKATWGSTGTWLGMQFYSFYQIQKGFSAPREVVVHEYFKGEGTTRTKTTKEEYEYSDYFMPKVKRTLDGNDNILTEAHTRYPVDYDAPGPIIGEMINRNIIASPVETKLFRYDRIIAHLASASAVKYDLEDNIIVPRSYYRLNHDLGTHDFSNDGETFSSSMQQAGTNTQFDADGNVLESQSLSGITTSYIWGYNNLYPIAKLIGVSRAQVDAQLSNNFNGGTGGLTSSQETLLTNAFPDAQITYYKHNPGIGVSQITDPNGESVFYEYDNQGRLLVIRDSDQNILKKIDYNYQAN